MRIVVSDTCCMIDLRKAGLLEAFLDLPYQFVMPDTLFHDEWLCLSEQEKARLQEKGLEVRELPGPLVSRAYQHRNEHNPLALNDCFALALAEDIDQSILMSGDKALRRVADEAGIEVRGILWIVDELDNNHTVNLQRLYDVLQLFKEDRNVYLPEEEITRRLKSIGQRLKKQGALKIATSSILTKP